MLLRSFHTYACEVVVGTLKILIFAGEIYELVDIKVVSDFYVMFCSCYAPVHQI